MLHPSREEAFPQEKTVSLHPRQFLVLELVWVGTTAEGDRGNGPCVRDQVGRRVTVHACLVGSGVSADVKQ